MLENKGFIKTVSAVVICSFSLAILPQKTNAQMLVPVSFAQMYSLAKNGNVEALRASVRRGMNIDVMAPNGDTGLCIAARRGDAYTYNAFRAAGANPRHPCTQTIENYERFVNSSSTAPVTGTSRTAYGMMGKESYSVSPWVWWVGGAALVGGGVAIALSGGGGGGGGGDNPAPAPTPVNKIDSAAKNLAANGVVRYTASNGENKTNSSDIELSNDKTDIIKEMNYNKDVTANGENLNVILRAVDSAKYTNKENITLTANSGVVGMSSYKDSVATNNGIIKVIGSNAAIGMLAGQNSTAVNNGADTNGINITFSGYNQTDTLIGMYADSGSTATNNGLISGTATLTSEESGTTTATTGSMLGMEVVIINANPDSKGIETLVENNGDINLAAGQGDITSGESVEVSVVGMGSFLDDGFLNGSKFINRAESAKLTNNSNGKIILSYNGQYSSAADYLRQGIGGIVGMKADTNVTATNRGKITINMSTVDSSSTASDYAVAAGMQSVHGGTIINDESGEITATVGATDNRIAYGMVAVEGSGTVSGLYTITPTVTNKGTIKMQISNGYGMASYVAGTLDNTGTLILGKVDDTVYTNNVGMYGDKAKNTELKNTGNIIVYSNNSVAMQNDFSGGTTLTNDGTITIEKSATGSHPFAGNYSNIINNGTVDYRTTPNTAGASNSSSSSSSNDDEPTTFPEGFDITVQDIVISTNNGSSEESSSTVKVTNNGDIKLTGSSHTAAIANDSALGSAINNDNIELNDRDDKSTIQSVGIYVSEKTLNGSLTVNNGTITVNTKNSAGIFSKSAAESVSVVNGEDGRIKVVGDQSIGIFVTGTSNVYSYGTIEVIGKESIGILISKTGSGDVYNRGTIIMSGENALAIYIIPGSGATVKEYGEIIVDGGGVGIRIDDTRTVDKLIDVKGTPSEKFTYYEIGGDVTFAMTKDTTINVGTLSRAVDSGKITVNSNFSTGGDRVTLFKGSSDTSIINNATINVQNKDSYGIDTAGTAENKGTINVISPKAYGMRANATGAEVKNSSKIVVSAEALSIDGGGYGLYAQGGGKATNTDTITVSGVGSYGAYASESSTVSNAADATITASGESSYGAYATGSGTTIENSGTITATGENSHATHATSGAAIINAADATIEAKGTNSYAAYANSNLSEIENSGTIKASGASKSAAYAIGGATITNKSGATIETSADNSYAAYATGTGAKINNSGAITATGAGVSAAYGSGGASITNASGATIEATGSSNAEEITYAAYVAGSGASIQNSGTIKATGAGAFAAYGASGASITNASGATIELVKDDDAFVNTYAAYVTGSGASIENSGTIKASGMGAIVAYALDGASIINNSSGIMEADSEGADVAYVTGSAASITNSGTITASGKGSHAAYADNGASVTNNSGATIEITGEGSCAVYAVGTGEKITNAGAISVQGNESYGIHGLSRDVKNSGTITVSGEESYGIYSTGGSISNENEITVSGKSSYGVYNKGGVSNSGTINVTAQNARGIYVSDSGSVATNEQGATITVNDNTSSSAYGILAFNGAKAYNKGKIEAKSVKAKGMHSESGATMENSGTISVSGSEAIGMEIYGGSGNNTGTININNSADSYAYGMVSNKSGAVASNNGTINVTKRGVGMYADVNSAEVHNHQVINVKENSQGMSANHTGARAINYGTINVSGETSRGMLALDGAYSFNLGGKIYLYDKLAVGMEANGKSGSTFSYVENNNGGKINVYGDLAVGMQAVNGGVATNKNGIIDVQNPTGFGMIANGAGSAVHNEAIVYVNAESLIESNGVVAVNGGAKDGHAGVRPTTSSLSSSKALMATNGGKILNSGLLVTSGKIDFDASNDGTGTISVGNGGTYVADAFSGNVVADSSITLGGFDTTYTNENSFVGEDQGINISSGSYMFNAEKTLGENGNTGIVMTMKSFDEVVENSSLSDFLSENYAEQNNEGLFNSLKSASNSEQFNQNLDDAFGRDMLSNLTFEDLNIIRELNFDMNNQLFEQKKGTFSFSDGVQTVANEKFGTTGQYALSGYNNGKTSVAVGLSVADVRSDLRNNRNNRLDKNIMVSLPVAHKAGGFELMSSPKLGFARGRYERDGINSLSYEGTIERKMFGLMNEVRYPFSASSVKIIPSAEFNMIGYNIKGREDAKQFSLNIDSQNHYSVESGLGINLEKEFAPNKSSKLKLNGGVAVYKEFADPYDLKIGMNGMDGTYKMQDEKHGDKRTIIRFGAKYQINDDFDLSAVIRTNIDRESRTDAGVNFKYSF